MKSRSMMFVLLLALAVLSPKLALGADNGFQIYLVRHAEKVADGSKDPQLDAAGQARAEALAEKLAGKDIQVIWVSDYLRTRTTAAPLARQLGFEVMVYDPRELDFLANRLLDDSVNALVVGHSNTTPELGALLCGCEVEPIEEDEYHRLLLLEVEGEDIVLQELGQ